MSLQEMAQDVKQVSCSKCFEGHQMVYEHSSRELGCRMKFTIFLPSATLKPNVKLPVVYFLSGLGSTEENFIIKSGFQRYAEQYELIVVGPDTSPRGCNVPGEDDEWDLGTGAGFYVDATQEPWSKNYRMYSYVTQELREVVEKNFPMADCSRVGISGHSMGGHGALVAFLRNPDIYKAATAFAPLCNPTKANWGIKCLTAYLGSDEAAWKEYDATELVRRQPRKECKIIIDQGTLDKYWPIDLMPEYFKKAADEVGQPVEYNLRDGYDHGFYFVSTFVERHLKHLSENLKDSSF